jgi:hypothetical protein
VPLIWKRKISILFAKKSFSILRMLNDENLGWLLAIIYAEG